MAFHPAYLIHGDDHGRIAERRASLRGLAESAAGTAGVEVYEADQCTPETVAAALLDYWDLGVDILSARGYDLLADAEEFGREVIPLVREGVSRREAEGRPRGVGTLRAA